MDDDRQQHADPLDTATDNEMVLTEATIRHTAALAKQQQQPNADGTYDITDCIECDLKIDEERLKVAPLNLMCVYCAGKWELKFKSR